LPVPLTVSLAESGSLGLAGPRERLSGLARAVLAQYAALHSPDTLEIVLVSTDRHQPLAERVARWGWLGWLPHVRPTRGQGRRALRRGPRAHARPVRGPAHAGRARRRPRHARAARGGGVVRERGGARGGGAPRVPRGDGGGLSGLAGRRDLRGGVRAGRRVP